MERKLSDYVEVTLDDRRNGCFVVSSGQGIKERGTFRCLGVNASVLIHKDGYSFLSSFLSSFLLRCQNQPRGSLITMGFSSALGGVRRYSCWTYLLLALVRVRVRTDVHDTHSVPAAILVRFP